MLCTTWYESPGCTILAIVAIGLRVIIIILAAVMYSRAIENARNSIRAPDDDGHELLERQEPVEDRRKSEESIETCYEFEEPLKTNAKLEE